MRGAQQFRWLLYGANRYVVWKTIMSGDHQRIILLNRLVSRSSTRAPQEHSPPTHGASELLEILEKRRVAKQAIEFFGADDNEDDSIRITNGAGHDFLRLRRLKFDKDGSRSYATLLLEFVDQGARSFPVDTKTYSGREISGDADERRATAHPRQPWRGTIRWRA